jgi:voltage-gated potassium channel
VRIEGFQRLVGLAGVADDERELACRVGRVFDKVLILVALLIPVQWYFQSPQGLDLAYSEAIDWAIWLFFLCETLLMLLLVRRRRRYLRGNWMNLVIIASGLPLLWPGMPMVGVLRGLRLMLFLGLLPRLSSTAAALLSRNHFGYTLLVMGSLIAAAGVLVAAVEPGIKTPLEGVWWALVTASTVGYGDIVPTTTLGRAFASLVIILGLAMVALITANISAFLVDNEVDRERRELLKKLARIEQHLFEIDKRLRRIERAERGDD